MSEPQNPGDPAPRTRTRAEAITFLADQYRHLVAPGQVVELRALIVVHNCIYGWADGAAHTWLSDRSQTTVLEFDKPARNADHPTTKPVDLFAYLIGNSCKPGGVVLDPFAGSGTTLVAAEQTGRSAALLELDPRYCDVVVARYETLTGKKAERANPPKP